MGTTYVDPGNPVAFFGRHYRLIQDHVNVILVKQPGKFTQAAKIISNNEDRHC